MRPARPVAPAVSRVDGGEPALEFMSYDIASNDFQRAGAASRAIKEQLKRIGADAEAVRRAMIAAYEAEMNVVIHSVGGRLEASLTDAEIDVSVVDDGPGIPDVEQAMVEGFSTASAEARALGFGAGMGLPNIQRNSDRFRITSKVHEGTRVSFTIFLKPGSTRASRPISLYASADRCRDCRACLSACPTQAMRVRGGRPSILEHLCIDCAQCIAACSSKALLMRDEIFSLDDLGGRESATLVVPPALLAGCGADYPPAQVLAALGGLGFSRVIVSEPIELALRDAAVALAGGTGPRTPGEAPGTPPAGTAALHTPVIVPSCPAIVNLIELRFPSLVSHLAPFDSPWEALQAAQGDHTAVCVVSCPSQRSAVISHGAAGAELRAARVECVAPEIIRRAVMVRLAGHPSDNAVSTVRPLAANAAVPDGLLMVTGVAHVMAVLEEIEDGLLDDVKVVEPYACEGGCFGSPLLAEDHHVAAHRWSRGRAAIEAVGETSGGQDSGAVFRRRPFAARPGIRLDADMRLAIDKLRRMQEIIHSLPGRDCGACGAPTCAALAEDVVMERAGLELCPYVGPQNTQKEARDR